MFEKNVSYALEFFGGLNFPRQFLSQEKKGLKWKMEILFVT